MNARHRGIVREFHRLYYERGVCADYGIGLHKQTRYHGVETHKCPLDLWVYQELLCELRPSLVVELGTYLGGTTLFIAHQLDALMNGQILTVDVVSNDRPAHSRITYLEGDTADERVIDVIGEAASATDGHVLVIHDADHRYEYVIRDLAGYSSFVTPGSYLIVEDTNVNGHPVLADWGAGPWEAVDDFLKLHGDFERDAAREKFLLSYNPGGFLRRKPE